MLAGESALMINRMFPLAHKYIALAAKASGDLAGAVKTMKHAVLYEASYGDKNKELDIELLREIKMTT